MGRGCKVYGARYKVQGLRYKVQGPWCPGPVIGISDSMIFLMAIPNVIGMYLLAKSLKKEIHGYRANIADGTIPKVAEH